MELAEEGSEEWQAAKENWMDAVEDWRSSVEDAVDNITNKYINAINLIFEKLNDISQDQIVSSYKKEVLNLISNESRSYKEMRIKKIDLETAQKKLKYLKGLKYFAINIDKLYSQMQDMELEDFKSYVQKLLELDRETIDIILEMKMDSIVGIEKVVKKLEGIIADLRKEIEK